MADWIRAHVSETLPDGKTRCIHCGAYSPGDAATCIARLVERGTIMPEPALRTRAADDFDAIGKRLEELKAQQQPEPIVAYRNAALKRAVAQLQGFPDEGAFRCENVGK